MVLKNAFENLAVESKQDDEIAQLVAILAQLTGASGPLTDVQLRATPPEVIARLRDEVGAPFTSGNPLPVDVGGNITINDLTVNFESILSTANIPPAPLLANETFVGAWEEVKDFASIAIAVFTDQYSTVDGAAAQFSVDGINVVREERATLVGGLPAYFEIPAESRYFRIVVENGPVAQTFLQASIIYRFNPPGLIHSPLATPSDDLDIAGGVKAHLVGRYTAGAFMGVAPWVGVQVDSDGKLFIRELALDRDSVRQTQRPMSSYVATQQDSDGTVIAADVTAPTRVRLLRIDGGSKPSNSSDTFCTVTITLGTTDVFIKELQVGEPIGGQVCIEGAAGEDLKVTVTGTGFVQFNLRYETFV